MPALGVIDRFQDAVDDIAENRAAQGIVVLRPPGDLVRRDADVLAEAWPRANLGHVIPGPGLIAFTCVVVLTMLASQSFDTKVIWNRP